MPADDDLTPRLINLGASALSLYRLFAQALQRDLPCLGAETLSGHCFATIWRVSAALGSGLFVTLPGVVFLGLYRDAGMIAGPSIQCIPPQVSPCGLLRQLEVVMGAWRSARGSTSDITEDAARLALERLDPLWEELFPAEQARIIRVLVDRVDIGADVRLRLDGLASLVRDLGAPAAEPARVAA